MQALQIAFRSSLRNVIHYSAAFFLSVFLATACLAQNISYTQDNVDQSLRGDLNVDPSTLGMSFNLTLGAYAGRGPSLPVTMNYGSKVWRINYISNYSSHLIENYTQSHAEFSEDAVAGWTLSLDAPYIDFNNRYKVYDNEGRPACVSCDPSPSQAYYIDRITLHMPDGSAHELRKNDTVLLRTLSDPTLPISGVYVAVDGSRLKYNHDEGIVYLPDGSRYLLAAPAGVQYIDRNGNTLTQNLTTKQWTDTLGRVIGFTLDNSSAHSQIVTLSGLGNSNLSYTLVWKNLQDALAPIPGTNPPQYPALRYDGDRYGGLTTPQIASPSLFQTDTLDFVWVNNSYPPNPFNPVVLGELILPNGQKYVFSYNEFGEMAKVTLPTGGYQRYEYAQIPALDHSLDFTIYGQANRGVVRHAVCVTGDCTLAQEQTWTYSAANTLNGYTTTVTNSQGAKAERRLYVGGDAGYGFENARAGRAYEERTYSASGQMLRRTLVEWTVSGPSPGGYSVATRDARGTKKVEILLDTGGNALAATTVSSYDSDLNEIATTRYDYVQVDPATAQSGDINSFPLGTLLRTEESTFLVNDTTIPQATRDAYRARHLISLPSYTRVTNGAAIVAETQFKYDEAAYPPLTYGVTPTGWINPGVNERGNVTTTRRWLNISGSTAQTYPNGSFLETHAQYDQCGNLRKAWDGNGKVIETFYNDSFSDGQNRNTFAYATSLTTPAPDPTGNFGSDQPFTSSKVIDFNTGKLVTATDANNKTTSYFYTDDGGALDSLQRLRRVTLPDGLGETKYEYGDTPGDFYIRTLTKQDAITWLESRTNFDGLGRAWRSGHYEGPNSWSVTDTEYDSLGRVNRVTNPYFADDLSGATPGNAEWTTTTYDDLNRVSTVTAPDGATVQTSYNGNQVTVQDAANKRRRSEIDALGRLVKVTEDPSGLNFETTYLYDALGNLRKVTQGAQTHWFAYDSLSRLIRVKNPEQDTNTGLPPHTDPVTGGSGWSMAYSYDANGNLVSKTDARNITTNYKYDALNRNTTVDYSNTPALNPDITRVYDNPNNPTAYGKGRLWLSYARGNFSDGTDTDHTAIDSYDALGRPLSVRQHFKVNGVWKPGVSVGYTTSVTYDLAGNIKTMTYPSGRTVDYTYGDAGRLSSFTGHLGDGQQRTYSAITQYHPSGMIERETFGTQTPLYHKLRYNNRLQLGDVRLSAGSDALSYDRGALLFLHGPNAAASNDPFANDPTNNGNLIKQLHYVPTPGGGEVIPQADTYTYDPLNRISSVVEPNVFSQTYDYDRWGNRRITGATGSINNYNPTYDEGSNRIVGLGYDQAGNITSDLSTGGTMTYDAENRLLTASSGGAYAYNADGKRTRRTSGAPETWYIYGIGGELLAEYSAEGAPNSPQKEYGYRGGELLIIAEGGSGGGVSLVKPASQSKSDLIGKAGSGSKRSANRIFSLDKPLAAFGRNKGYGAIAADSTDSDNSRTLVRGAPKTPGKEDGDVPSANDIGGTSFAEHPANSQPAAPRIDEYGHRGGRAIFTAQSGNIVTVNPGAYQTPAPGQVGEGISDATAIGHPSATSSVTRGTKGISSKTKTCSWYSFPGVSGTKTRVTLKFEWTLNAGIDVSVFEGSFASAAADYGFGIEYSLNNGSTWIPSVSRTDSVSISAPGSDDDSVSTSGSESIDLPNPSSIDITQIRVRDRIDANASLMDSSDGSASGFATATVSFIRLEVELLDTTAPVITGVSSSPVTHNSATINWTTNENSDSEVVYGTTTNYGQTTGLNPLPVTSHSQGLSGLAASTTYHYRVKSKDSADNLATSEDFSFTTAPPPDITPPTVTSFSPGSGATNVNTNANVTVTFSEAMNASTVDTSTIELRDPSNALVSAAVSYNPATFTATLDPNAPLAPGTPYTARVRGGSTDPRVKDAAGNALAANLTWTLTTALPDTTPPTVTSFSPAAGATNVNANSNVTVTFSEAMNAASLTTSAIEIRNPSNELVSATISYNPASFTVTLDPTAALTAGTTYIARVRGGSADPRVKDAAGNALTADVTWTFTTAPPPDTTPPAVASFSPALGATNVNTNANLTVTFSEAMGAATISASTIELRDLSNILAPAGVSYDASTFTATLDPTAALAAGTTYTARVRGGGADPRVKDAAGNALAADVTWTFTTASAPSSTTYSIWPATATPATPIDGEDVPVELGLKFRSDSDGFVTGVRFYKGDATNGGTHVGHLWTSDGTLLGTVTFSGETTSGWQQALFPTPIPIAANTTYVVSYFAPQGHYAGDVDYFASSGVDNGPLHALSNAEAGGNGVYHAGSTGGFPTDTWNSSNYWVDVEFIATPPPPTCPCSIWGSGATPATPIDNEAIPLELGLKFRSNSDGLIAGVRFYKGGAANGGTHVGHLWTSDGTPLGSVTFTDETESGWQQALFPTPIPITANTTYVISYFAPQGHYAANDGYFASSGVDNGPLHALSNAEAGGNGVYLQSPTGGFPTDTFDSSNYWVDVVFTTGSSGTDTTPPTVSSFAPAAGAADVNQNSDVIVVFSEALNAATVNASTVELRDPSNALVSATVSYDAVTFAATLNPSASLAAGTTYTARVRGGSTDPRVKDAAGNALAADLAWTFTTAPPVDTTPPTVISFSPASGATNVNPGANVIVTFSEAMDAATVNASTVELRNPSNTLVSATVSYDAASRTATLGPTVPLSAGVAYTARVRGGGADPRVKDVTGNALAADLTWTFTTAQNGGIKWLVTDHLGSTRMVVDETGSLAGIKRHDFLPFGEELFANVGIRSESIGYSGDTVRQKFTGYEHDSETNLEFAQARYYSAIQGRFTSPDPLLSSADPFDPQSWNRYCYVGNRPLIVTDPTGLKWFYNSKTNKYGWCDCNELSQDDKDAGWEEITANSSGFVRSLFNGDIVYNSDDGDYIILPHNRNTHFNVTADLMKQAQLRNIKLAKERADEITTAFILDFYEKSFEGAAIVLSGGTVELWPAVDAALDQVELPEWVDDVRSLINGDWFLPDESPYSPENVGRRQSDLRDSLGLPRDPDTPIPDQPPGHNLKGGHQADTTPHHGTGERNVGTKEEHSRRAKGSYGRPKR